MVRVKAPRFDDWWHQPSPWAGDPMKQLHEWLDEEFALSSKT
jgi:hypothetical protein